MHGGANQFNKIFKKNNNLEWAVQLEPHKHNKFCIELTVYWVKKIILGTVIIIASYFYPNGKKVDCKPISECYLKVWISILKFVPQIFNFDKQSFIFSLQSFKWITVHIFIFFWSPTFLEIRRKIWIPINVNSFCFYDLTMYQLSKYSLVSNSSSYEKIIITTIKKEIITTRRHLMSSNSTIEIN